MGRLDGRVALITGAASGIGEACALRFAQEGAAIAGVDVVEPSGQGWKAVASAARDAATFKADVRDEAEVREAVSAAHRHFGRFDVLVNAAGVAGAGAVTNLEEEEWDRIVDINLKGTYLVCKHVIALMAEQGSGSVINLASIEGIEAIQAQAAYNASKGGVILLTKNMAIDFGSLGVRVNCLCPGYIETPLTAVLDIPELAAMRREFVRCHMLDRPGRPDEVAAAALFLASDDASFVTGSSLVVDGGFTAGRRLVDPE